MTKAPKKDKREDTEEEAAFKEKKKAEEAALKAAREKGEMSVHRLPWVVSEQTCSAEKWPDGWWWDQEVCSISFLSHFMLTIVRSGKK